MTATENQSPVTDGTSTETEKFDAIAWRREKVLTLRAKGYTYDKIVQTLKAGHPDVAISHGTIANDLQTIKEQVNAELDQWVTKELPMAHRLALQGIMEVIRSAWELADSTRDEKTRLQALGLVKDAYVTQKDFLSNSSVLNKTIRWIEWAKKELEARKEK